MSGKAVLADLVALLVVMNPFYRDFSHQAMTEVPVIAWALGVLLLCDIVFAQRKPQHWESFLAEFVRGLGMLVKGSMGSLIFVPVAYSFGSRQMKLAWKRKIAILILFGIGFVSPFSAWMVRNSTVSAIGMDGINSAQVILSFQKEATDSVTDSESISFSELIHRIELNLRSGVIYHLPKQVIPGLWPDSTFAWKGSGWLVLGIDLLMFLVWIPRRWKDDKSVGLDFVLLPMMILFLLSSNGYSARYWVTMSILFNVLLILRLNIWIPLENLAGRIQWLLAITVLLAIA
jgi:hypothetical protein